MAMLGVSNDKLQKNLSLQLLWEGINDLEVDDNHV